MRKKEGFGLSSLIQTALPLSFMSSGFLRACHLVEALVASMAWRINLMRSAQFTGKRMQSDWMLFLISTRFVRIVRGKKPGMRREPSPSSEAK